MTPSELPDADRDEWYRLNDAMDEADESGDADAIEAANDAIVAFAKKHGITDGCDFDPDKGG